MSEVKRYSLTLHKVKGKFKSPEFERDNGEWVKYEDYARLHSQFANSEQENARLKADIKDLREDRIRMCDVTIEDIAVIARLKAEVERLRKAGDDMADHIQSGWVSAERAIDQWNAAKESKPSA